MYAKKTMGLYKVISDEHGHIKGLLETAKYCYKYIKRRKKLATSYKIHVKKERNLLSVASAKFNADDIKISFCIPLYNPNLEFLKEAVKSIESQTHNNWEICFADDYSSLKGHFQYLHALRQKHGADKIKINFREENGNISQCTNSAISDASSNWIILLDQDDTVSPYLAASIAATSKQHDNCKLIYTDEDKIDEKGIRHDPYFKPDYNPELMRSHNLFTHALAFKKEVFDHLQGFDSNFDGAQDYDFSLRAIEILDYSQIYHIPSVLYHWRAHAESTALNNDSKPYAMLRGCEALQSHLNRLGVRCNVKLQNNNSFKVDYSPMNKYPLVSIIIPTRDQAELTSNLVEGLTQNTDYPNLEIVIVDNGSKTNEFKNFVNKFLGLSSYNCRTSVISDNGDFNYSRLNNFGVKASNGSLICLMNNDIEVIDPNWLKDMVSILAREEVGVVGPMLLYPDLTIQHAGIILGIGGWAGHLHKGFPKNHPGCNNRLQVKSNFAAVTGACLLTQRDLWNKVGGLNESELKIACNDVDFCLKAWEEGKQVVYTPHSKLIHHESKSRGYEDTTEKKERFKKEVNYMLKKWRTYFDADPFYNPNLSLETEDGSVDSNISSISLIGRKNSFKVG